MKLHEDKLILKLKSRFFELFEMDSSLKQYDRLVQEMVDTVNKIVAAEKAVLFIYNHWQKQLEVQAQAASPKGEEQYSPISSSDFDLFFNKEIPVRPPDEHPVLKHFDLLLPLSKDSKILGLFAFKGMENCICTYELFGKIEKACSDFLYKVEGLKRIIVKENRYKQLFRVTEKFHSSMDMDAVLGEIIDALQKVYPTFTYYLMLSHDSNNHPNLPIKELEYDGDNLTAMQAYVTGEFQLEDSIQEKKSILYAPLKGKQGVYGVLQIIASNSTVFPESEIEFITLLANTAGSALENAQLYQQSKKLVADLQLINETSRRLNSTLRLTETIQYMTERIIEFFDAEEVGFVQFKNGMEKMEVLNGSTEFFYTDEMVPYMDFISARIKNEKEPLFIGDLELDGTGKNRFRSIMAVPMEQAGNVNGFALVMHREPYHFTFDKFNLLRSLIQHSTLAFMNLRLREELEKMVITDYLTRLYTRNYLEQKVTRSIREDGQGTLILIDIDNFKEINDTYGHQIGDDVLIQVAKIIKSNIRETDTGARWGGEEMAIYLPNVSLKDGFHVGKRIMHKIREETNPSITVSCGIANWKSGEENTYNSLFNRADKALYQAKSSGKNKIVIQDS